jgi:hypothetical protein
MPTSVGGRRVEASRSQAIEAGPIRLPRASPTLAVMKLDPDFKAIVDRARVQARERGELRDDRWAPSDDLLPAEARAAVVDWMASGDYDRAVGEIVADDPDLATQ